MDTEINKETKEKGEKRNMKIGVLEDAFDPTR